MTPNEIIGLVIACVSIGVYYYSDQDGESSDKESDKTPEPDKESTTEDTAFTKQVKTILASCPYASDSVKISYLTSNKSSQDIVMEEMIRLGENKKGPTDE